MSNEIKKQIEKPWAVYTLIPSIVKIIREEQDSLIVRDSESQSYLPMLLSHNNSVKRFDTSYDAIEYFCKHYWHSKQKMIQTFLISFPSERNNIEKLLAQSKPKCTESV